MKKTTKRRNIYGLPVEIDNHLKLEAEHQNISVNQLFLKIIQDYYSNSIEKKVTMNINSDLRIILTTLNTIMNEQSEIQKKLDRLETIIE
ncbi:hypothetical protein [Staphylococcus sp. RIT622]|uniref:hypothetical protein n=1 Tax=Staphylococcus sp. RIT622 TaxID=2510795 RepID=UPI00101E56E9|nr:hypothetical protein [Staphylococcus sp. RIT622]MCG2544247.1 hypothetical protein [Staphylococcus epidermidis]RYL09519.1 hypothetical protein EU553_11820 [Staphylococcus sp. RIT622]